MMNNKSAANNLKVSVVLTVLNEGSNIKNVVTNLLNQTRKPDEIVVCDAGSRDDTVIKLQQLITEGIPLRVIVEKGACRGAGRNRAIEAAVNPVIALTDAGTNADSRWLEDLLLPCINNPSIKIVYGTVIPKLKNRFSRCLAALTIGDSHIDGRLCPSVASLLLYKRIWQKVGGFPEGLTTTEDLIFLDRLNNYKASSQIAINAAVYWSLPSTFSAVFRRFSAYSRGSLAAGFIKHWHYGTIRNCFIFIFLILLGIFFTPWLLIGLPCFQALRVNKYLSRMPWLRHCKISDTLFNYISASFILAVMDLATLDGLWRWIFLDHCCRKKIT